MPVQEFGLGPAPLEKVLQHYAARGARSLLAEMAEDRIEQLVDDFFFRAEKLFRTQPENRVELVAERRAHAQGLARESCAQVAHFRYLHRLPRLQPQHSERREYHRAVHELGPLRAFDIVGNGNAAGVLHDPFQPGEPRRHAAIEFAQTEPCAFLVSIALNQPRREHLGGKLDHATHDARPADDVDDGSVVHAVLQPDDHAIGLEIRFDKFSKPARIVRLRREQNDVELAVKGRQFAQMVCFHRRMQLRLRHLHVQSVRLHGFDMRGPLIDKRHIVTRLREVGADAAADGAGAQNRNFHVHPAFPKSREPLLHIARRYFAIIHP